MIAADKLSLLNSELQGEVHWDDTHLTIYATDASVYKEKPQAVAFPKNSEDLISLVHFAKTNQTGLIPRTAGTSLAGQVVGNGIVVDVGRYMNQVIEFNPKERYVWVEPGVNLEELNKMTAKEGLFFGPETSTANRCMIGGMLGNNACGLHSLVYGSTRDHTLEVEAILSDGSTVLFADLSDEDYAEKKRLDTLEGQLYRDLDRILGSSHHQALIKKNYPDPGIPRRNTGYALDLLLDNRIFGTNEEALNLCKLLGGSEGTLVLFTKIKLNLVPLPPPVKAVLCAHFSEIQETLEANLIALKQGPTAVELMDSTVLSCTKSNKDQEANRYFVEGDPRTILIIEFAEETKAVLDGKIEQCIKQLKQAQYGYAYPVVYGEDINKVWNLRKAGLGLLANIPGDEKSVTVIEDTAVHVEQLPAYIAEIEAIFERYQMECVYHAHIGTGELHLRPVLNLKSSDDVQKFRGIAEETVSLIKKYRGSFSGEHGDGRLRANFIKDLYGDDVYSLLEQVKMSFDPDNILNPGKIVNSPPMDEFLRYEPDQVTPEIDTYFDFSSSEGFIRAIEKCNGSGDCRKSHIIGGTLCPSYQATLDERNSTRARANMLREYLSKPTDKKQLFNQPAVYEILDLCLSCKACKNECPSSVDMAKLKAEFLSHWYAHKGIPLRTRVIGGITKINRLGSIFPALTNLFLTNAAFTRSFNKMIGFAQTRSLPTISKRPLIISARSALLRINPSQKSTIGQVCLYIDEFSNYNDAHIGLKAIHLLTELGYRVVLKKHDISARSYLSKGLLKKARRIIDRNVTLLKDEISDSLPLIGIEPSAILGFRDEYPDLVSPHLKPAALELAKNCLLIDEFIANELKAGRIASSSFTGETRHVLLHGHCQQKAVASTQSTLDMLSIPKNYRVTEIPSGCCGMAGSFGYEAEHYELSMKVGELVLFPAVRSANPNALIAAGGTSCRHQIKDGTGKQAHHPIEILHAALFN